MSDEKRAIRRVLRERRRGLPAAAVEAAGAVIGAQLRTFRPYQEAHAVIGYLAHENEVPITPLLSDVVLSGRELYLPQSADGVRFVRWRPGEPLGPGSGGVLEPLGGTPSQPAEPTVALIPVVGWDEAGGRLGRGGGFYDRILAVNPEILRIGLAYEFQQVPELPRDSWDVPLDFVITERRIVQCVRRNVARSVPLQKGGLQL
jgi:5-formyltetrahydrofolate cyclo-ligase